MNAVVKRAQEHSITLVPEQVTVQRIGTPGAPAVYVAADYSVPVNLAGIFLHSAFQSFERQLRKIATEVTNLRFAVSRTRAFEARVSFSLMTRDRKDRGENSVR